MTRRDVTQTAETKGGRNGSRETGSTTKKALIKTRLARTLALKKATAKPEKADPSDGAQGRVRADAHGKSGGGAHGKGKAGGGIKAGAAKAGAAKAGAAKAGAAKAGAAKAGAAKAGAAKAGAAKAGAAKAGAAKAGAAKAGAAKAGAAKAGAAKAGTAKASDQGNPPISDKLKLSAIGGSFSSRG